MPITDEEANQIKEHLLGQLENFPEDKRSEIASQIGSMTNEQIENFVKQNNLTHLGGQCIFCSIIANKSPSFKVAEDATNVAILELNPLSKGHALIVPKEHLDKIPESASTFAQEVAKRIQERLNPKEIKVNELKIMKHSLLEVVPIYGDETERKQATEEELKSLQEELTKAKEVQVSEEPQEHEHIEIPKLPMRIP